MEYWMIITGDAKEPGINGGLMPRHDPAQPDLSLPALGEHTDAILDTLGYAAEHIAALRFAGVLCASDEARRHDVVPH